MPDLSFAITGDKALLRMCEELPAAAQNRVLRPLMREAAAGVVAAIEAESPRQSGLLAKAVGASSLKSYSSGTFFITAGVRRGFKRRIARTQRGGLRVLGKKASAERTELPAQDPTKYLHIVTKGRKAIEAINRKVLYDPRTDTLFGRRVAKAEPNPFVSRAFDGAKEAVTARITATAEDRILAEARSLLTK